MSGAEIFDSVALGVASSAVCWAAKEIALAAKKIREAFDDLQTTRKHAEGLTRQLGTFSRDERWGSLERFLRNQLTKGATR